MSRLKGLLPFAKNGAGPHRPIEAFTRAITSDLQLTDAYGTLLSSFRLASNGTTRKTILVTSTQPGEGKTTISLSLAIVGLLAGQRVLLSDGDLRRPSLHRILGLDNNVGLSNLLNGTTDVEKVIQTVDVFDRAEGWTPLEVIVGGPASPNVLQSLGTPKLKTAIADLARNYDLVLMDSPPALAVNDPALLASAVDGILLVIGAGSVGEDYARRTKEQLERSGTPIIGVVLNRFEERRHGSASHPYQSYYGRDSK